MVQTYIPLVLVGVLAIYPAVCDQDNAHGGPSQACVDGFVQRLLQQKYRGNVGPNSGTPYPCSQSSGRGLQVANAFVCHMALMALICHEAEPCFVRKQKVTLARYERV